jgi:inhibitor of cysteine peptidase
LFAQNNANVFTDPQKSIMLAKNNAQFSIKLPSNPSTGYTWRVKSYDPNLITPISQTFMPAHMNNVMGAGGFEILVFRVNQVGFAVKQVTQIALVYVRPWNMEVAKQATFTIVTQ